VDLVSKYRRHALCDGNRVATIRLQIEKRAVTQSPGSAIEQLLDISEHVKRGVFRVLNQKLQSVDPRLLEILSLNCIPTAQQELEMIEGRLSVKSVRWISGQCTPPSADFLETQGNNPGINRGASLAGKAICQSSRGPG
jgi:hypothetical protein